MEELTNHQLLLREIKEKLCGNNGAELARRIGKDSTYVTRLLYPPGKAGRKGIGLEIMEACNRTFFLPPGFWDMTFPALGMESLHYMRERIEREWRAAEKGGNMLLLDQLHQIGRRVEGAIQEAREPIPSMLPGGYANPAYDEYWDAQPLDDEAPMFSRKSSHLVERPKLGVARRVANALLGYPTMQPILSWQHEDELPDGEFVMIPRLEVHLSAGAGSDSSQVEIQFNEKQPQAFRAEWVRQQHLKPKKLAAMTAKGNSMEPTIHDGDSLLVDTSQVEVQDGKVYALWYEGGERVKRLYRMPGGGLRIRSDNPEHPEIVLTAEYLGHVRIIGRVVHRSGMGGL